jgi:hypothetical protein
MGSVCLIHREGGWVHPTPQCNSIDPETIDDR